MTSISVFNLVKVVNLVIYVISFLLLFYFPYYGFDGLKIKAYFDLEPFCYYFNPRGFYLGEEANYLKPLIENSFGNIAESA